MVQNEPVDKRRTIETKIQGYYDDSSSANYHNQVLCFRQTLCPLSCHTGYVQGHTRFAPFASFKAVLLSLHLPVDVLTELRE